jgi:hypothetical protein
MLACGGRSSRDGDEDGDHAGEGGAQASGGAVGKVVRGGAAGTSAGGSESRGGTSGTASGGTAGTAAGGASGTRGGSSGSSTGGSSAGGSSGTSSGGASGSSGSSGTNTCMPCLPSACSTVPIPTRTINDFENLLIGESSNGPVGIYGALDEQGAQKPEWWLGYFSGAYVYPTIPEPCSGQPRPMYPLTMNDMNGELRVTGGVHGISGFGIWLGQCVVDMSGYGGISFRMGGNLGTGQIVFSVFTNSNLEPDSCLVGKGACDVATVGACAASSVTLTMPASPGVFRVPWSSFAGGVPESGVDPSEVVQLNWEFYWAAAPVPYQVDVIIDDVVLFD